MEVPVRGVIILVDPRTEQGKKYVKGDKPEKASKVVSYTYLRACILKNTLLPTTSFKGVSPVFEAGPIALKIFLDPRLAKSMSQAQLDELKLKISVSSRSRFVKIGSGQVPDLVTWSRVAHCHILVSL